MCPPVRFRAKIAEQRILHQRVAGEHGQFFPSTLTEILNIGNLAGSDGLQIGADHGFNLLVISIDGEGAEQTDREDGKNQEKQDDLLSDFHEIPPFQTVYQCRMTQKMSFKIRYTTNFAEREGKSKKVDRICRKTVRQGNGGFPGCFSCNRFGIPLQYCPTADGCCPRKLRSKENQHERNIPGQPGVCGL